MSILGYFLPLRTQNLITGSYANSQMVYKSKIARYTNIIWTFRVSDQIICSQLATFSKIDPLGPKSVIFLIKTANLTIFNIFLLRKYHLYKFYTSKYYFECFFNMKMVLKRLIYKQIEHIFSFFLIFG